jgi:hypothetical protein
MQKMKYRGSFEGRLWDPIGMLTSSETCPAEDVNGIAKVVGHEIKDRELNRRAFFSISHSMNI